MKKLKAAAHWPIFCRRTADFLSGSNWVKTCRTISLPHTSRMFVGTNAVRLGPESSKSRVLCLPDISTSEVKIFGRPTKNRLVCGGLKAFEALGNDEPAELL